MLLSRISSHLALCLFAVAFAAGQNGKLAVSLDSSTTDSSKNKPSAGIPLTTAEQGKKTIRDRRITQRIRRALTKDKSLSISANNVKVVCQNGMVMPEGPVRSEDEKQSMEAKAADVVGSSHVTSEPAVTNAYSTSLSKSWNNSLKSGANNFLAPPSFGSCDVFLLAFSFWHPALPGRVSAVLPGQAGLPRRFSYRSDRGGSHRLRDETRFLGKTSMARDSAPTTYDHRFSSRKETRSQPPSGLDVRCRRI